MKKWLLFSLVLMLVLTGCSNNKHGQSAKKVELTVSAAASLQDALNKIKKNFEKEHSNVKISYNFGASGALQQQISQGAPVDLFFSAAEDKYETLVKAGMIKQGKNLVGNELVLVVPKDSTKIANFNDLVKADKISIGTPETVPAGQYAKQTLENIGLWKAVSGKMVYAKDVRQVLTYVETGNVDAGIVYKTDALTSSEVKMAAEAEEGLHAPIIYPLGVIKDSSHPKESLQFYKYLQNAKSMNIFKKYGFKGLQ